MPPNRLKRARIYDWAAAGLMGLLARLSGLLVILILAGLFLKSMPILRSHSIPRLLFSSEWYPLRGQFGFLPFLAGSLWVTGTAMILAVPLCLLTAIYLAEVAPRWIRETVRPMMDVLAGIPSVVYGLWGVLTVVPWVKGMAGWFGFSTTGYCVLSAGIVLAVMISPVIIHMTVEILKAVPQDYREASLSLGATQWETIRKVVLRKAFGGISAAIILGLSRAFGETMAVLMVAGNTARIPLGFLDSAYPLPALVANNYGEMMSIPLYDSAMMLACLILLGIVLVFHVLGKWVLMRIQKEIQ